MKSCIFAFFLLIVPLVAHSMDIKPSQSILGVLWNSSEKEVIEKLGEPNGHFKATKYKKWLFYGKNVVLVFEREKLTGFKYSTISLNGFYDEPVSINSKYNNAPLIMNGVKLTKKTFDEIDKSISMNLGEPDYEASVATDEASITFRFSSTTGPMHEGKTYKFSGIEVEYEL